MNKEFKIPSWVSYRKYKDNSTWGIVYEHLSLNTMWLDGLSAELYDFMCDVKCFSVMDVANKLNKYIHDLNEADAICEAIKFIGNLEKDNLVINNLVTEEQYSSVQDSLPTENLEENDDLEDKALLLCMKHKHLYSLLLELTYVCNESCQHCFNPVDRNDFSIVKEYSRGELNTEDWKRILKEAKEAGALRLTLTGGEALVRKDFWDILSYARKLRYAIDLYSNGVLLTKKTVDKLRKNYIRSIHVSLYSSNSEKHDTVTRLKGSFDKTLEGIKNARSAGIPVQLKVPLMSETLDDYKEIQDIANELGCSMLMDTEITPRNNGDTAPITFNPNDKVLLKKIYADKSLSMTPTPRTVGLNEPVCGAGHINLAISPKGDVLGCNALPITMGSVADNIADVWKNSEKLNWWRGISMKDLSSCSTCSQNNLCNHCPGVSLLESGDVLANNSLNCFTTSIKKEVLDELAK